jgi:hypothetical protein
MRLVHHHRTKATLEQMARPPEPSVDRPGVAPVRFGKGRPQPVRVRRRHDQVDVIGHRAIGPHCCTGAPRRRGDQTPVAAIVVGLEKHGLKPITALGDMVGQVRHNSARDPGHACASFRRFTRLVIAAWHNPVNCHRNPRHRNPRENGPAASEIALSRRSRKKSSRSVPIVLRIVAAYFLKAEAN